MERNELTELLFYFQDQKELLPKFIDSLETSKSKTVIKKKIEELEEKNKNPDMSYQFWDSSETLAAINVLKEILTKL